MMRTRIVLMTLLVLGGAGLPGIGDRTAVAAEPSPAPPAAAPTLNGVDFTGLSGEQIAAAMKLLGETRCNCGCGMTLSECRVKDPNCGRSLPLARSVVADFKAGKDLPTVKSNLNAALAKAAAPPPTAAAAPPPAEPGKAFKIDITGSPYRGPKGAPVTVVVFSDYQ
jgi:hypothetical protein